VIAPAKTGSLKIKRKIVTNTLQINKGNTSHVIFLGRHNIEVDKKLMDLAIEDTPAI
jgi:hypothetical protein